jgi:hypothetical protein
MGLPDLRVCGWHAVTVKRSNTTSFYACSGCSVMFPKPDQFSALDEVAPNIQMPSDGNSQSDRSPTILQGIGFMIFLMRN